MADIHGSVIGVHSVEEWTNHLENAKKSQKLVVVDFTATWCGPCRFISPIFEEFAKKMIHIIFLKVDVDELKSIATEWGVEAMPTFIFVKDGNLIDKIVGADKNGLHEKLAKHAPAPAPADASASCA